ncbi:MAG: iron-containing alcohol dehydrogenase [Blautia sp.]
MRALILSGLAIQISGSSRPAAGAEHQISHLWRMEVLNGPLDAYHGERVGVGLLLCLEKYREIAEAIHRDDCHIVDYGGVELELLTESFHGKEQLEAILEENTPDPLAAVVPENLERSLPEIAAILDDLPDVEDVCRLMEKGGCKTSLKALGLSRRAVAKTIQLSPYTRNRLTLMRFLKMLEIQ